MFSVSQQESGMLLHSVSEEANTDVLNTSDNFCVEALLKRLSSVDSVLGN